MYQDGDILQGWKSQYVVLGIYEEFSSLSNISYMLYPDNENLFEQKLNPSALSTVTFTDMRVIGRKDKKELELWIMKNKMLSGSLPFVSVKQYMKNRHRH